MGIRCDKRERESECGEAPGVLREGNGGVRVGDVHDGSWKQKKKERHKNRTLVTVACRIVCHPQHECKLEMKKK